jgi:hypothetical protein
MNSDGPMLVLNHKQGRLIMDKAKKGRVKKLLSIAASFIMVCSVGAVFLSAAAAEEPHHKLIVLTSDQQAIKPDPMRLKQGATAMWLNTGKEPITIIFKTKIGIACKAPVNFYGDLSGHYETNQIVNGATASICFIDKGKFEYEVKRMIGKETPVEKILPGTVIVE